MKKGIHPESYRIQKQKYLVWEGNKSNNFHLVFKNKGRPTSLNNQGGPTSQGDEAYYLVTCGAHMFVIFSSYVLTYVSKK